MPGERYGPRIRKPEVHILASREKLKINLVFAGCVLLCLSADLWSKSWVARHYGPVQLSGHDVIPGVLGIWYKENAGGVFGIGQGKRHLFVLLTFAALVALVWLCLTTDRKELHLNLGIALVTAGALGNLYDRLKYGVVRDFIDFHIGDLYHWYTFNIADSCICIGVGLLALDILFRKPEQKAPGE